MSEVELKALNLAIVNKRKFISDLRDQQRKLDAVDKSLLYHPNDGVTINNQEKLENKYLFLQNKEKQFYSEWPDRQVRHRPSKLKRGTNNETSGVENCSNPDTQTRKKRRAVRKRQNYNAKTCAKVAKLALETRSVINLIPEDKIKIPDEAIAVLIKGDGFVPTPEPDRDTFRLDGLNCSSKLATATNRLVKSLKG